MRARATRKDVASEDHVFAPEALVPAGSCPVAAFQKMVNGKYKLRIVWDLKEGPLRYSEIGNGLLRGVLGTSEVAPRVLSRELKALTESGLIARKDYGVVPPKVDYRLTAKGRSIIPVIAAIREWGHVHLNAKPEAQSTASEAMVRPSQKR